MRPKTLSDLVGWTLSSQATLWEREPSTRDRSVREMRQGLGPHRIQHRFPIRGGLTASDLLAANVAGNNALLARLRGAA